MRKDLSFALRTLRRSPVFSAVAVLSLALGIGANTAIFSLLYQVVLRSLPVRDPQRLVVLHTDYTAPGRSMSDNYESVFSNPLYRQLRDRDPAFESVIARASARVALSWGGNTDAAAVEMVSGNFFVGLGVPAAIGRVLTPEDDGAPGAHPVVVLGHAYWSSRFGRSHDILNQAIAINGQPMVVVGVVSPRFSGIMPGNTPDVYVPIAMKRAVTPTWDALDDPTTRWLNVFARLKPGWSLARAQSATDAVYRSLLETELAAMGPMRAARSRDDFLNHRAELRAASQGINELRSRWEKPLDALMAMVALVLLIACANVAGLMLVRAAGRRREIAIRLAMGARRAALVRQLLLEGIVLALGGAALGVLLASWVTDGLIRLLPGTGWANWLTPAIDFRLLAFSVLVAVVSGILFAIVPAVQATRPDVADTLKHQAASVVSGGGPARFRKAMVTGQVALSVLLLVGAGLFAASLVRLTSVDLGLRPDHLLVFSLDATVSRHDLAGAVSFYREFTNRLSAAGDVTGVAAADGGPFSGSNRGGNITVEGYRAREDEYTGASLVAANPGYFRTLGIPLRGGREFTERDDTGSPKVVIVNEAFVKRYFAGHDAVGRHLMFGASNHPVLDREIVGVAADSHTEVRQPAKETLYYPYPQWDRPERLTFYVRGAGDVDRLSTAVRQLARSLDGNVPVRNIERMTARVEESIYTDRLIAMLSAAFAVLASLLAAIGLYGVMAYLVARRTAEIGLRMALGAVPAEVLRMFLADAARTAGLGIALGLAAAWVLSRYLESQLFQVKAADPFVFAGAALLLALIAAAAALVPGRRAARIEPVSALKYE